MNLPLCPAQQQGFEQLLRLLPLGNVFVLTGAVGAGRTTLLRLVHGKVGGAFLNMKDFMGVLRQRNPTALEETFEELVLDALNQHSHVIVDDLRLLSNVIGSCNHFYQRRNLLDAPLTTLTSLAIEMDKKLIFSVVNSPSDPIAQRCHYAHIREFDAADYESICRNHLGSERSSRLDYAKIFRFARELNAHQLKAACQWLVAQCDAVSTEEFIEYLRSNRLFSNVDLGEVQPVNLHDLKGVEDVIRSLEANIIVPLENDELAAELNLKPKRGVLLAGPPDTGKTTVGRALAHRLRSKFFLLDGIFINLSQLFSRAAQSRHGGMSIAELARSFGRTVRLSHSREEPGNDGTGQSAHEDGGERAVYGRGQGSKDNSSDDLFRHGAIRSSPMTRRGHVHSAPNGTCCYHYAVDEDRSSNCGHEVLHRMSPLVLPDPAIF